MVYYCDTYKCLSLMKSCRVFLWGGIFFVCVGAIMVGSGHAVYQLGLQRQWAFMATPFDLRVKDQILVYLHLKEDRDKHHLKFNVPKLFFLCVTVINYRPENRWRKQQLCQYNSLKFNDLNVAWEYFIFGGDHMTNHWCCVFPPPTDLLPKQLIYLRYIFEMLNAISWKPT